MPPVTWVPSVVPPRAATVLSAPAAGAACCPADPAKVHDLPAYRRATPVIEARSPGPAVTPHHA